MGAMDANADGTVIVGYGAGASVTTGNGNTIIGYIAGTDITTGGSNTIIGYQALTNAQSGVDSSTVIGWKAGQKLGDDGGSDHSEANIIIGAGTMDGGHDTLANNTANLNIAIGNNALGGNTGTTTSLTAASNTVIGHDAMKVASTAVDNVVVGKDSGDSITSGYFNTVIGKGADIHAANGYGQIVIGRAAVGTGNNETVIGASTQTKVTFGGDALISGSAASTGSFGSGIFAGNVNVTGQNYLRVLDSGGTNYIELVREASFGRIKTNGNPLLLDGAGGIIRVENGDFHVDDGDAQFDGSVDIGVTGTNGFINLKRSSDGVTVGGMGLSATNVLDLSVSGGSFPSVRLLTSGTERLKADQAGNKWLINLNWFVWSCIH